jgi:hypothetical protein
MVEALALLVALAFRPSLGWTTSRSEGRPSAYQPSGGLESTAWTARGVRYRDTPTADPPNRTLAQLPRNGIVVWAVVYSDGNPDLKPIHLHLRNARHLPCCELEPVAGGAYDLYGRGPVEGTAMIVRVYFGSQPTRGMRAAAQQALDRLRHA